ncbi:MAG: hypothetical protein B7733_20315 [Myxococcales bacterium FL481]|nr:MAG: hypothetical protein B7733_20315 [Myxococcales bacterium FL481]
MAVAPARVPARPGGRPRGRGPGYPGPADPADPRRLGVSVSAASQPQRALGTRANPAGDVAVNVAPELTVAAALRDLESRDPAHRERAIQSVAGAILVELGERGPSWRAAQRHPRGGDALEALWRVLDDERWPALRGAAFAALGQLGDASRWEQALVYLEVAEDAAESESAGADTIERECALIYISFVGVAARDGGEPEVAARSLTTLTQALGHRLDDVRFQAAMGLAEIGGPDVEPALLAALAHEASPRVRTQLVEALSLSERPSPAVVWALRSIVGAASEGLETRHAAAMVLAAARCPDAVAQLVESLRYVDVRDDAIEALAVFPRDVASTAVSPVRRLANGWRTPGATRVRAAYALCRWSDPHGARWLQRLRFHPLGGVRAAVRDARELLASDRPTRSVPVDVR